MENYIKVLNEIIENNKWTNAMVARYAQVDDSTISKIRKGTYTGNIKEIVEKILDVCKSGGYKIPNIPLDEKSDKRWGVDSNAFVTTQNVQRFNTLCENLLNPLIIDKANLGVVVGTAGRGKSFVIDHYNVNKPEVIKVQFISGMTANSLLREIADKLGNGRLINFETCLNAIENSTKTTRYLIIIDEADLMPLKDLETLRGLNERCKCPLILCGEENLLNKILPVKRFKSRIREIITFQGVDITDIIVYYEQAVKIKVEKDVAQLLLTRSEGDFRSVLQDAIKLVNLLNVNKLDSISVNMVNSLNERSK